MEIVNAAFFDHFMDPRNVGVLEDPDGKGKGGDPSCGDWLVIMIKVREEVISDIRFQCRGCSAAIATSSVTTELAKGKSVAEAREITAEEIEKGVGGLPEEKKHCSLLGVTALNAALDDYLYGKGKKKA
ncbi:MAG: iron-sulfur cluster assembly scaffold protein [Candidatus Krumholzibacteriota bacterium]|nr:iron-sulfur cluster assembly scaffold protein [Candidatus Krumholzibacteriota bacterium]